MLWKVNFQTKIKLLKLNFGKKKKPKQIFSLFSQGSFNTFIIQNSRFAENVALPTSPKFASASWDEPAAAQSSSNHKRLSRKDLKEIHDDRSRNKKKRFKTRFEIA